MVAPERGDQGRRAESEGEHQDHRQVSARRYRAAHAAELREKNRLWKAEHPEKVKEYRDRYRAAHREQVLEEKRAYERTRAAKRRRLLAAAERRRVKGRERYAADPVAHRTYQRERRAAQRAANPETYREAKKQRNKRWRDAHRDEQNAKLRAKHRENPELKRAAAARYYLAHGDKVRERRREYYRANREKQLAKQREWREREKRRLETGLPPRRTRHVAATQRAANSAAADEFFARERTSAEIAQARREVKTAEQDLARWARESARSRAGAAIAADSDPARPVTASQRRAQERAEATRRKREAEVVEEARMDAIARAINEQLRTVRRPAQHRRHAPPPDLSSQFGGLSL